MDEENPMDRDTPPSRPPGSGRTERILSGFALALAIAFSAYLLFNASRAGNVWFASLWFLGLFPALLSALIVSIGDADQTRSTRFYWLVPLGLVGIVDAGSFVFLREGVICLLMISPIWLASGWAGAFLMRSQRRRGLGRHSLQSSFLIIPMLAAVLESQIPRPHEAIVVSRSLAVNATPGEIWPFAVSNRQIGPGEGRWTLTHDIIGQPRPRATLMRGAGVGAVRTAYWGDHISFEERVTQWIPDRKLGWTFHFSNSSLQDYTDKHISPDGEFLKIESGDYSIRPLSPRTAVLTLTTRYIAMTHVNLYARLWGELLLGDTEDNILTIIKGRAEAADAMALRRPAPALR
jgi:hypothetical protein